MLKVNSKNPEKDKIKIAAEFIKKGRLVAFPTETVYGLGVDALNQKAVLAVFRAKKRPLDNPPIIHVADKKNIYKLIEEVPIKAEKLMNKFWPGPLTLIFKCSKIIPKITVSGLDTIAIRYPKNCVASALIKESECFIAAPSANLAGKPSPTTANHVMTDLDGRIDAVLDAGPTEIGLESTVLDLTVDPPKILRPGGVTLEDLKKTLGIVSLHPIVISKKENIIKKVNSPGMKYKHYAPNADLIVVEGENQAVIKKIRELIDIFRQRNKKIGVLATNETRSLFIADSIKNLGHKEKPKVIARNLFKSFRDFDSEGIEVIIAEGISEKDLGLAVMNRLRKASGYNIIEA